ncbi:MAG: glycosyl hydrolase family 18 protein [Flavobacteriales bacterium]
MFRSGVLAAATLVSMVLCAQQPALIGYYAGDGTDLYRRDLSLLTHVIHCFQHLDGDSLAPMSIKQEKVLRDLVGRKREQPGLKVLVSLGGWGGCESCSDAFGRKEGRERFARDVLALLKRTWTDGIDLDWEYPAVEGPPGHRFAEVDRHNFTLLVHELRKTLGDRFEISFAVGGTDECVLKGFEWDSIMPLVDRVHIMSYDLVHGYSTATGHHTPLYSSKQQYLSADRSVRLLDSLHVPMEKVVIGAAFYARVFKGVPATNNGLYQMGTFSHTISCSAIDTTIAVAKGWVTERDEQCKAAYVYNAGLQQFLTYDDPVSIAEKARYVVDHKLGGIMFWQLRDDVTKSGLMQVMHDALRRAP